MGTRTVWLDEDSERLLRQLKESLGLSISSVSRRGLEALRVDLERQASQRDFSIYRVRHGHRVEALEIVE